MNVYGYVRISRDDNKENYETIITQRNMINDYIRDKFNVTVKGTYEDDNISGYKFEREGLSELENEIRAGKVDVLVVKDLSRIGRNNALTLLFLDFLKEHNVRLISISDNYDSAKDDDDIIGIKTWYNERYVKDISKKITENIRTKQKNGGIIIRPCFGYTIDPKDKDNLLIDDSTVGIVRKIFQLYIEGNGYRRIASILNDDGVLTPSQYAQIQTGSKRPVAKMWSPVHVSRIINDDVYIGTLRCGKTKKKKVKGESVRVPKEDHIVYEDHHAAIIIKEDFELAQNISKRRDKRNIRGGSDGINLFSGFLTCGDCGKYMIKRKRKNRADSYVCGMYHANGNKYCTSHHIKEEDLLNISLNKLQEVIEQGEVNVEKIGKDLTKSSKVNANYGKIITSLKSSIINKKEEIKNFTRQFARGLIDEEIYKELVTEANQELKVLNEQLTEMEKFQDISQKSKEEIIKTLDELKQIVEGGEFSRRHIELLIENITVYHTNNNGKGQQPEIEVVVNWGAIISSMCYHSQVVALTHGNIFDTDSVETIIKNINEQLAFN